LAKRGAIVSREELLDAVYKNPENISSNTVDVTITNIRKKLPVNIITTIKTRGFKIEA
jgi:DNA-binding response OmpR family regulator